MATYVVREDGVSFEGTITAVYPPLVSPGSNATVGDWIFAVKPDAVHAHLLTTRTGLTNADGHIQCSVRVGGDVVDWGVLLQLALGIAGQRAKVVGTWCDEDDAGITVIRPLGVLAALRQVEVYDIGGWPTAVQDVDLLAFAHAGSGVFDSEPHAGESQSLTALLRFPLRPSDAAEPFFRAYASTIINHVVAFSMTPVENGPVVELEIAIETGEPSNDLGFLSAQVVLTFREPQLDNYCPPGTCDLDGHHCAHEGDFRFMRVPTHVPFARTGDLALSPGDGRGMISGIVASLEPSQVYDHMGIFIDNGWTIRHCTSSEDHMQDESLYTAEISIKLVGVIELVNEKIPLNGLRPDLVRFGWPGSITQRVEEVYRTGRNTLNPRWMYGATHPGADTEDPENPGEPFRIYHLPRAERLRRLQFNDPEIERGESITRLMDRSVRVGDPLTEFLPRLVHPHPLFDTAVRPALAHIVEMAKKIDAHYRFFAYSKGDIGLDSGFVAPPLGDPAWDGLSSGAAWPAGTIGAMCSSFIWTAVQQANADLPAGMLPITLETRLDPEDPASGLEYGSRDGTYVYQKQERLRAANTLAAKLKQRVVASFDKKIPGPAYAMLPVLAGYRDLTAFRVANQVVNTFAFDASASVDERWKTTDSGESASPDDTMNHWELRLHDGELFQPEGKQGVWGASTPLQLAEPQWRRIPLFRKQEFDLGTGHVTGVARVDGTPVPGATIRFDFGCESLTTTNDREVAFSVELGVGRHFADGFIVLPNPVSGNLETFRTARPIEFDVQLGQTTHLVLDLEPPSDLWRIVDVQLEADIHDRSFWGGDADARTFTIPRSFELRQDLEDDPDAPDSQRNTVLHHAEAWRTEPAVGSGVHVAVALIADLDPSDRSVRCHCDVALIDTDSGGFLGIGTSSDVDQLESRDVVVPADGTVTVLSNVAFSSNETVPERATVTLRLGNRRRPS